MPGSAGVSEVIDGRGVAGPPTVVDTDLHLPRSHPRTVVGFVQSYGNAGAGDHAGSVTDGGGWGHGILLEQPVTAPSRSHPVAILSVSIPPGPGGVGHGDRTPGRGPATATDPTTPAPVGKVGAHTPAAGGRLGHPRLESGIVINPNIIRRRR